MAPIYFILDRSGSMSSCINDTLGGFNHFLGKQKKDNPTSTMSLILFAHDIDEVYNNKSISDISELVEDTYFPRGTTALLDAIGITIKKAEKYTKPMIVILTDGEENSSKIYTHAHVKDLIEIKKSLGWEFVFLGANQDAIKVGGMMGISEESAMTFNPENVYNAFEGLSCAVGRQMTGEDSSVTFTGLERQASQQPQDPADDINSPNSTSEVFNVPEDTMVNGTSVFVGSGLARC